MQLKEFITQFRRPGLAFSGGVDSAYLLWAMKQAGCDLRAWFFKTPFQPDFELEDAQRLADEINVELKVISFDILKNKTVAENPADRCYHCKTALFRMLLQEAHAAGCDVLFDGTNASDDASDRPGMRALAQLGIRSPLRECGLRKSDIRALSKQAGLFTHDKPSYACLATRIPTGTSISYDLLNKAQRSENCLFAMGFSDFRVRVLGDTAKIQVVEAQMPLALEKRQEILQAFSKDFHNILLDLAAR